MAITRREQIIIDQYEAGTPMEAIARQLGVSLGYVKHRVNELCVTVGPDRKHGQSMVRGCQQLAAAIFNARRS